MMKALSCKIIPMTRAHIPVCAGIVAASEPWKTLRRGLDFADAVKRKRAHVAVARGAVAGFIVFDPGPVFARGGYLRAIGVAPESRGAGVGRKLLSFAERTTAKKAPNLYLCVSSFNRGAQAFYRKCGFTKVGKLDDLIRKGFAEFIYRKRLGKRS